MGKIIRINIIDGCRVETRLSDPLQLTNKKSIAILGYLAVSEGGVASRERLCGLFWSESEEQKAKTSLRQCLKLANSALNCAGLHALETDRDLVRLPPSKISLDIDEIWQAIGENEFSFPALLRERMSERLFDNFDDIDPAFGNWLYIFREETQQKLLSQLSNGFHDSKTDERKLWAAKAIVKADPTHEQMVRQIMELEVLAGNMHSATREFHRLEQTLREVYEVDVEPETKALIVKISSMKKSKFVNKKKRLNKIGQVDIGELPIIAVQVSDQITSVNFQKMLAIKSMMIGSLARFKMWTVMDYDQLQNSLENQRVSKPVFVLVLNGADEGDGFNVTVDLSEFDNPENLIATQHFKVSNQVQNIDFQSLVHSLSSAMNIQLTRYQIATIRSGENITGSLFEKWLEGQTLLQMWSPDAEKRAEILFLEAIHQNPDHGELHARLADIYNSRHIVFPGTLRNSDLEFKSHQLAKRAVLLDPINSKCLLTLGWSQALVGKHNQAIYTFKNSADLNKSDPDLIISAVHGLAICGNIIEAVELLDRCLLEHQFISNLQWGFASHVQFMAGDFDKAIDFAERSGELKHNILGWKCATYGMLGRFDEAKICAEEFVKLVSESWFGPSKANEENIVKWFLHIFPFGSEKFLLRLKEGLHNAGLNV